MSPTPKQFANMQAQMALRGYSLTEVERGCNVAYEVRNHTACFVIRSWHSVHAILARIKLEVPRAK